MRKLCLNPHDTKNMPKYLPAGLTQYVLHNHTVKSPPYHITANDVEIHVERVSIDKITTVHRLVRGRGGKAAVMYETYWEGIMRPSWELEIDLRHSRREILLYCARVSTQKLQGNIVKRYQSMRKGAAARELNVCSLYRDRPRPSSQGDAAGEVR